MILVDSNVLLDIFTLDDNWYKWSFDQVASLSRSYELVINDIIYAEVSVRFTKIEDLEKEVSKFFKIVPIPKEALFLAGKVFAQYKLNKGQRNSILPDFFIGAHASILPIQLLTRDLSRYKTYFPELQLIATATD